MINFLESIKKRIAAISQAVGEIRGRVDDIIIEVDQAEGETIKSRDNSVIALEHWEKASYHLDEMVRIVSDSGEASDDTAKRLGQVAESLGQIAVQTQATSYDQSHLETIVKNLRVIMEGDLITVMMFVEVADPDLLQVAIDKFYPGTRLVRRRDAE